MNRVDMNLGSGGRAMHSFIHNLIANKLGNGILERFDDSAVLPASPSQRLAMTTDSYVVSPLHFPGGDIGRLCIAGTVNDLSTSGAVPHALSLAFILEEGTSLEPIAALIDSIADTAREANVRIVTGDTKVVEKGKGDQLYINTCGIGFITDGIDLSTYNAVVGDAIFVTGPIGNHEVAMMKARHLLPFDIDVVSDVAPLNRPLQHLLSLTTQIHTVKDPTRGGLAGALSEIADHSKVEILIHEDTLPVDGCVRSVCELAGFDPLYLANEGKFILIAPATSAPHIQAAFPMAVRIGDVIGTDHARVLLETKSGGRRKIGMLETMQLPRIC